MHCIAYSGCMLCGHHLGVTSLCGPEVKSVKGRVSPPPFVCQHPLCKASAPVVASGALPPVTAPVSVHSILHRTTVSPVLRLRQWRSPDAARVQRGNHSTVRHVVVLAGCSVQGLHLSPCPHPPAPLCAGKTLPNH